MIMFACSSAVFYRVAVIYYKLRLLLRGAMSGEHALPLNWFSYLWSCRVNWFRKLIYKNNKLPLLCWVFSWISSVVWFATCLFAAVAAREEWQKVAEVGQGD